MKMRWWWEKNLWENVLEKKVKRVIEVKEGKAGDEKENVREEKEAAKEKMMDIEKEGKKWGGGRHREVKMWRIKWKKIESYYKRKKQRWKRIERLMWIRNKLETRRGVRKEIKRGGSERCENIKEHRK